MRKLFINQILLLTIFVLGVCNINAAPNNSGSNDTTENKIEIFEVAESLVYCEQMVARKCLNIKREGKNQFIALWDDIENFKFIDGYKYVLKVEVKNIEYPPKDTSGYKYYLKEILSREKVENIDKFASLYLSKWELINIKGKKFEGNKPFLVFDKNKETLYENTGCNSFGGSFNVSESMLETSKMRQTKRACANMQTVERPFVNLLSEKNQIEVETDRLYIKKNGVVVLEFRSNWSD